MQTSFSPERLAADPTLRDIDAILRTCVHCGFCTATCPTSVLLGNELDSPRGRIYLLKDLLESGRPASAEVVTHIDRCLTCQSCMTTCPSGVDYVHLLERGRARIEETHRRAWSDRLIRDLLAALIPYRGRFRLAMALGWMARPLARLIVGPLARVRLLARIRALMEQARRPPHGRSALERPTIHPPTARPQPGSPDRTHRRARVILHIGCVQPALMPQIDAATLRLLTRLGVEVVVPQGQGCCGAAVLHLGKEDQARALARANIAAWWAEREARGLDAILSTASGCGATVKDYGHLLRDDPDWADKAAMIAGLTCDISEYLDRLGPLEPLFEPGLVVAYHAACSLQHGQRIREAPKALLRQTGYVVKEPTDGHLCCGSAGTYAVLEPELSAALRARKIATLEATAPAVIAGGNIGCLTHLAAATRLPVVHTVELLDWATGGPRPAALAAAGWPPGSRAPVAPASPTERSAGA